MPHSWERPKNLLQFRKGTLLTVCKADIEAAKEQKALALQLAALPVRKPTLLHTRHDLGWTVRSLAAGAGTMNRGFTDDRPPTPDTQTTIASRHVTYAPTPQPPLGEDEKQWLIKRLSDKVQGEKAYVDPEHSLNALAARVTRPSSTENPTPINGSKEALLRHVAAEQRKRREAQDEVDRRRLQEARGRNGQTRRPSSRKQDILADGQPAEVFEQGVLASEIGLVAPSAARRGPIIRPNIQDLASAFDPGMRAAIFLAQEQSASAGDGGPFGSVSRRLNENSEAAAHNRALRQAEYARGLREQISRDRQRKSQARQDGVAEREIDNIGHRLQRERLRKLREQKMREAEAEGVKPEYLASMLGIPL
jgi:hypothetical protein